MSLDDLVSVSITANTTSPSRTSFGTPGLLAYVPTSVFPERSREYNSLTGMISDGFLVSDPAYLMATALKAQNPSVKKWKVLRKALPSEQTIRVTPTITTEGEVLSLTVNGTEVTYTIPSGATINSIATALQALFAAIVGVTAVDNTGSVQLTPKNVASATLTVDTNGAGTYTVTIDGTDYAFTATAETKTEIRDALQALILVDYAAAECVDNSTDALDFAFASHAGADLRETATGGTMSLSAEVSAYRLLSVGGASLGLTVKDQTPDPGIATDWAAIVAYDNDFYGVGLDNPSEAEVLALAAQVETTKKIFCFGTIDTENMDAGTTTDVFSDLEAAAYVRTIGIQALYNSQYVGMRWLGQMLPYDPGSATWAFKTLRGATVTTLSAAQESALDGKTANHYTTIKGVAVTLKGYSSSGEFVDITTGVDWFSARLQERIYGLLVQNAKISYADAGPLFRSEIFAQLKEAEQKGLVAADTEDTPWVITIPEVADISTADKALRNFPDVEFSAYLAGAVHTVAITGTLSL
jgi:hypothetical protein